MFRNQTAREIALTLILLLCCGAASQADELPVKAGTDAEIGDRLRIRSKIMRLDPVQQTFLIAEKEVRLLDHNVGGQVLKTRLLDEEGKPAEFASFRQGETVLVLGYKNPDGHIYAYKIQRVDPNAPAPEPASNHKSQFQRSKTQPVNSDQVRRNTQHADNP